MNTTPAALAALAALAASAPAQRPPEKPEVLTLSGELREKTEFLNPEFLLLTPKAKDSEEAIPLIIYLHGAGGVGDDVMRIAGQPRGVVQAVHQHGHAPCLVVAPQCLRHSKSGGRGVWTPGDLNLFLAHLKATLPVDEDRVYLTGNSMGGYGTWVWAGTHPEHFAAIAPVVGGIGREGPKDVTPNLDDWIEKLMEVPIWAFAGGQDKVVPAEHSERIIKAVKKKGHQNARVTVYPDMGHNAGKRAYQDPELYAWLFSQTRE